MVGFASSLRASRVRIPALVSAVVAAGLVTVAAPLAAPADATGGGSPLTCTTGVPVSNVLGPATGWTEFIQANVSRSAESEGAVAYGGNMASGGFTAGAHLPATIPNDQPTAVIGGNHTGGNVNVKRGSAYVGGSHGTFDFGGRPGSGFLSSNPIAFGAAFEYLRDLSSTWANAPATGTITESGDAQNHYVTLTGTNSDLNVFSITQTEISLATAAIRIDVPANSTTIINVTGTSITFGGSSQKIELRVGSDWQQVGNSAVESGYTGTVWNFPTATTVTLGNGGNFGPTVLAPNAHVIVTDAAHTVGQMIAKSFDSTRETHLPLFQSESCVPGTPEDPEDPEEPEEPGVSDVTITKSASTADPKGGDTFTYTLTATNLGDADATGVVIRDELPNGVTFVSATTPCTQSGGVVTCNVGTLAPGASTTVTITVTADPIAGAGSVNVPDHGADHWLTPYHDEVQVDLEPGQQRSISLSCQPGDILSDGNFRIDHVDQGTGTHADVKVLSSRIHGTGVGTWKGVIRNDALGRAQAKAFIVCLPGESAPAGTPSHKHELLADASPIVETHALAAGRQDVSLTCRPGTVPVAPGYEFMSYGSALVGSETDYATRTWTFTFDMAAPGTVTVSVRCLSTTTTAFQGHTHHLRFTHVVQTVTVPGHTEARGDEFKVICPDDAKGVVATFDLPPGVTTWGNDPRIKERAFRLFNNTGHAKQAVIDLVCLHDRVGTGMGSDQPVSVVNTATVSSSSIDANPFNNAASATVTVKPGSTTAVPSPRAAVAGKSLALRVSSSMPGTGKVKVKAGGKVLAKGTVKLRAGATAKASVKLTKVGQKRIGKLAKVKVVLDPTRGRAVKRIVHLS